MNKNFGKLDNGNISYAPSFLKIDNVMYTNPTDEQYITGGWKKISVNNPEPKDGYHFVFKDYTEDDRNIHQNFELVENKVTANTYQISKLKLKIALIRLGIWDNVQEWMQGIEIDLGNGKMINCYQAYNDALVLDTGDELFEPYLEQAKERFKDYISPSEIDQLLIKCRSE